MSYFLIYLIKSTVYLGLFYAFFLVAMRKTTFFRFNRWMLLVGTLACMLLPCHTMTVEEVEGIQLPMQVLDEMLVLKAPAEEAQPMSEETLSIQETETSTPISRLSYWLIGIYTLGAITYLIMVIRSFAGVWKLIARHPKQWKDGCWLIVLPEKVSSFSWSNYIIISEEDYRNYPQVLVHERMHYQCRHSYDILFMTIVHALHWFNPMVWLIRTELKQLHEFEADEGVINQGIDATQYQLLLVKKAVGKKLYTIANGFNHTKLQKRITMMIQEKSNGWERLKWLVTVPVVMGAMLVFAQPEVKERLEEVAPIVNQQDVTAEIASLKQFFSEHTLAWENRVRRPDGIVVLSSRNVHQLLIDPNNNVTFEGKLLMSNYQEIIQEYLAEARTVSYKETGKDEPQHILLTYSTEGNEAIVLKVLTDIKKAYDQLRATYIQQGVTDIESVCPYLLTINGPYNYWPGGVEITFVSKDGSQREVTNEFNWRKWKEYGKKFGKDAKVTFKVDPNADEWRYEFTQKRLKSMFNHVEFVGEVPKKNMSEKGNKTPKTVYTNHP